MKNFREAMAATFMGSRTEWYEVTMGALLLAYAVWTMVWHTTALVPLTLMMNLGPPVFWSIIFLMIGSFKIVGVACRNDEFRHIGAWGATLIWLFLFAQYAILEPARLAVPTFGVIFLSNAWIVVRSTLRLDRDRFVSNPPCSPSSSLR